MVSATQTFHERRPVLTIKPQPEFAFRWWSSALREWHLLLPRCENIACIITIGILAWPQPPPQTRVCVHDKRVPVLLYKYTNTVFGADCFMFSSDRKHTPTGWLYHRHLCGAASKSAECGADSAFATIITLVIACNLRGYFLSVTI